MLSIIVAVGKNNVIGKGNKLIWRLPEDMKRFKNITTGKTIIMGRKTFESLGRILPNRKHIVLTRNNDFKCDDPNVKIITDVKELDEFIKLDEECFVIGGAMIYKTLLPYVKKMYITKINEAFEGDAFFPEFDESEWEIIEKEKGVRNEDNPYDYTFITYEKK